MCGRYHFGEITEHYWAELNAFTASLSSQRPPAYNIAPTQHALVFRHLDGERQAGELRWGLIPGWSKDDKSAFKAINARSETVTEKPMFRSAFKRRRCLIPATGYYEWQKLSAKEKQPHSIQFEDGRPMLFFGLWESWTGPMDAPLTEPLESFTILTTDANDLTRDIHDRMPCIAEPDSLDLDAWLDAEFQDQAFLQSLLKPYDGDRLMAVPVSAYVGNVRNQGQQCIEPIKAPPR